MTSRGAAGLPDDDSLRSSCRGRLLALTGQMKMPAKEPALWLSRQVSNRAERKENARWAFLARGQLAGGAETCHKKEMPV